MNHFIRGYFDGDGCIHKIKNTPNSFIISIVSNNNFIEDIQKYLRIGYVREHKNYSILEIYKIDDIKKFRDFIYKNSTIYLERKKEKFDLVQDEYKRDYSMTQNKYQYKITNPFGEEIITNHLRLFCNENNLVYSTMSNLSRGIGRINKGWKCKLINKLNN